MKTENIFGLCQVLKAGTAQAAEIFEELHTLSLNPRYRQWAQSPEQLRPFELSTIADFPALSGTSLVAEGKLTVRVNRHGSRVFVTDDISTDATHRVFPYADESASMREAVIDAGWLGTGDTVLDLAGGCGHTAWSLEAARVVLFDINPRALAYAELNRLLNRLDSQRYLCLLNDIRNGVPTALVPLQGRVLVTANMPFSPSATPEDLPLTTAGGTSGMDLQHATFNALERLRADLPRAVALRAVILGLTVGNQAESVWELPLKAVERFGSEKVSWNLLKKELAVRLSGVRKLANPCQVREALPAIAACPIFTPNRLEVDSKVAAFRDLAELHVSNNCPDLAYGYITVEL